MFLQAIAFVSSLLPINDVRVGDDGEIGRVVIECSAQCRAEPLERDRFLIIGAAAELTVDTRRHSRVISQIALETTQRGAVLDVETRADARAVTVTRCGPMSLCFAYELAPVTPVQRRDSYSALTADLTLLTAVAGAAGDRQLPDGCTAEMRQAPFWQFWARGRTTLAVTCETPHPAVTLAASDTGSGGPARAFDATYQSGARRDPSILSARLR